MTATEGRLWTLKEIIDYCKEEQGKCEGEDRWVVIGNGSDDLDHCFPINTEVTVTESDYWRDAYLCKRNDIESPRSYISKKDVENRKNLYTDRYNALQSVIDKCNELMNSISVAA